MRDCRADGMSWRWSQTLLLKEIIYTTMGAFWEGHLSHFVSIGGCNAFTEEDGSAPTHR